MGPRSQIWIAGAGIREDGFSSGVKLGFRWRRVGFAVVVGWISRVVGSRLSDIWSRYGVGVTNLAGRRCRRVNRC